MNDRIKLMHGDCLELMKEIPDGSVDLVLTDLPFAVTNCKWDSLIPFEPLWEEFHRVGKLTTPFVLFGIEPFSSHLRISNIKNYKYEWIWRKPRGTGFLNAKKQPLRDFENIMIFYRKQCCYNPQFTKGEPYSAKAKAGKMWGKKPLKTEVYGDHIHTRNDNNGFRYPKQVLEFGVVERDTVHPTQKPVELLEYLIKTYSNENDIVLDATMGSGSIGVSCINTNRKFVGIELDDNYFKIAKERIEEAINKVDDVEDAFSELFM